MRAANFSCIALLCLAALSLQPAVGGAQPAAGAAKGQIKSKCIVFLLDRSESMKNLDDTSAPLICHMLKLAELSGEPISFVVVFFGGDGVRTFPPNGIPTTGHKAFLHDVIKNWPKPNGGTPLDAAMQEAVRIVASHTRGADVSLIMITDGAPSSGWLRPEAFIEVKAEIERQVKAIQANPKGYPPATVQQLLARLEKELQDPQTEFCQKLYQLQVKAEFKATLDHAKALKQAGVRFVSVDFGGGIPELKEIHDAAGGKSNDLMIVKPANKVIAKLHALGLTALPQIVVQDPLTLIADPNSFERAIPLKLDPLGDKAVVTLVFDPPVPDFDKHFAFDAVFDGNTFPFSTANDDPSQILSFDSVGKVATAHLVLDKLPDDRLLSLNLRSAAMSMAIPACDVYVHLRLAKDILPQFRPQHAPPDAMGPFRLSPNQESKWIAAYRSKDNAKPYPVKSVEAVLRNTQTGAEVRLPTRLDPQTAFTFITDPQRIPRGTYNVTLQTLLESGAGITTLLPKHIDSQLADECISMEITQKTGADTEHFSHQPGHIDFGELGDDRNNGTVAVTIRTLGIDYDVPVEVGLDALEDSQGKAPKESWVTPDRKKFLLKPGKAERLLLTLKIPEQTEDNLVDGVFKGQLNFLRRDLEDTVPVKRFQRISGVPDDEPVNLVTFTLRRPQLTLRAPRCFRNTLMTTKDGRIVLPLQLSIAKPFTQTVALAAVHSSLLPRQITALPEGTFRDGQGRQIPFVRLLPLDSGAITQEVPPGGGATWNFLLEFDEQFDATKATGKITLSCPGLPPVHVTVEIHARQPMLGKLLQRALWIVAGVAALFFVIALVRYLRARTLREGKEIAVSEGRPLADFIQLKMSGKNRVCILPQQAVLMTLADEPKKRIGANQPIMIPEGGISAVKPLMIEELKNDDEAGWRLVVRDLLLDPPEIHVEIDAAPVHAARIRRHRSQAIRRCFAGTMALALAWTFFTPPVLEAAQWLYDLFSL